MDMYSLCQSLNELATDNEWSRDVFQVYLTATSRYSPVLKFAKRHPVRHIALNHSPRRSPRLLNKVKTDQISIQANPNSTLVAAGDADRMVEQLQGHVQSLRRQLAEQEETSHKTKKQCFELQCKLEQKEVPTAPHHFLVRLVTFGQEALHRHESRLDEYGAAIDDMSNRRMEADEEIRTLRSELEQVQESHRQAIHAKEGIAKHNVEQNQDLVRRLSAAGKQLALVINDRTRLEEQLLNAKDRLRKIQLQSEQCQGKPQVLIIPYHLRPNFLRHKSQNSAIHVPYRRLKLNNSVFLEMLGNSVNEALQALHAVRAELQALKITVGPVPILPSHTHLEDSSPMLDREQPKWS
ncbi:hypothetical protein B0H11DRAFT_1914939 [Mycena galericulata]|nr:hypothetical protein B0H11DRAFT_1914939 [Mycena galericulata]